MSRKSVVIWVASFLLVAANFTPLWGQSAEEHFGKNRVQYKTFEWKVYSTKHFQVYYHKGGKDLARYAARIAEDDFKRITEALGFASYSKTRIIVFNSIADLHQSNIGLSSKNVFVGGKTDFVKARIQVAFTGKLSEFKRDIAYKYSRMLIREMLYGGSIKDMVQSSYLLTLPAWFVEGASAYVAEGWSEEMDNRVRDLFSRKKIPSPSNLIGEEARLIGQSVWNYIDKKYGRATIANILNLTRLIRDEEEGVSQTLGIPYKKFIQDWKQYYLRMTKPLEGEYGQPDSRYALVGNNIRKDRLSSTILSPDREFAAYVKNYNGKYQVVVKRLDQEGRGIFKAVGDGVKDLFSTGIGDHDQKEVILKGGHKQLQEVNYAMPLLAWKNSGELAVLEREKGVLVLKVVNIASGEIHRRSFRDFNNITGIDFSDDGEKLVISGIKQTHPDLFLYNYQKQKIRRLTNDIYDDTDPAFFPDSYKIAFSSGRPNDSTESKAFKEALNYTSSIFTIDPESKEDTLSRISGKYSNAKHPLPLNNNEVLYLNGSKGIYNLYRYHIASDSGYYVSAFLQNIESFQFNNGYLLVQMLYKGNDFIFYYPGYSIKPRELTQKTKRRRIIEETLMPAYKIGGHKGGNGDTNKTPASEKEDPAEQSIDIDNYQFEEQSNAKKEDDERDTGEESIVKEDAAASSEEVNINGPFEFIPKFSADYSTTSLRIDPLRGLGLLLEVGMSDMFNNHRFTAGMFGLTDLKSSNVYAEYEYLKHRVDYGARYERKTVFVSGETLRQRFNYDKVSLNFSYPFSFSARVSISPFYMHTNFTELTFVSPAGISTRSDYLGNEIQMVYDNTLVNGLNMIEGTRMKVNFKQYAGIEQQEKNFNKIEADFRHYQKVHKEIVLATRAAGGSFFGNDPKHFLLGGMDNWWFASTDVTESQEGPLTVGLAQDSRNLLFVDYATSVRGFDYNKLNGHNYMLFNGELRIPVVQYLTNKSIGSSFFRNLQLIGFGDAGTAWSSGNPFTNNNSVNTHQVQQKPFKATVVNYKNPFIMGYGLGIRSILLGYYMKFDVGWGVEDNEVLDPMFYFTFGYDF